MKNAFKGLVIFVVGLLGVSTQVYASEFSADMITTASGKAVESKISVKGQKSRMEMPQATMVNRGDLGVAWMLMPSENLYMEHPLDTKTIAQTSTEADGSAERVSMGPDTIDGRSAEKFKVTCKTKNGTETFFQWVGANRIPLKATAADESWSVEYRNIQTGGIDDSLFEIPQGMQKIQMPSMHGMMGSREEMGNSAG